AARRDSFATRRSSDLFAAVSAMAPLVFSRLALGIKKIGDGGTPQYDGLTQDFLQRAPQGFRLPASQLRARKPCGARCKKSGVRRSEEHTSELQSRGHL